MGNVDQRPSKRPSPLTSAIVLQLGPYVRRRMAQRRINESEIEQALSSAQTVYPSATHPDREVVLGVTDAGRRLKVVRLRADPTRIVTVADRDSEE